MPPQTLTLCEGINWSSTKGAVTCKAFPWLDEIIYCCKSESLWYPVVQIVMYVWTMLITHWGRVTHICVSKLTIIGSDNGLSPDRRQASIWTNAGILLIGPLGTNFSEISIEILTFSFKKMRLKVSSAKRRPFCLGLNVLTHLYATVIRSVEKMSDFVDWISRVWRESPVHGQSHSVLSPTEPGVLVHEPAFLGRPLHKTGTNLTD